MQYLLVTILRAELNDVWRKEILPKLWIPKFKAGIISNRYKTVIKVIAQYFDVVLSHIMSQKGGGLSLALLCIQASDKPIIRRFFIT